MSLGKPAASLPRPPARHCTFVQRARPAHVCRANYRWSAEGGDGRKRESLYGLDDKGEPRNSDGGTSSGDAGWSKEWQQWLGADEDGGQQQRQQQSLKEQQQVWEAVATASDSLCNRPGRRRARFAAPGNGNSSSSRLAQRRQKVAEKAAAAAAAAGEQEDPWVQAELRQLRRKRAAAAAGEKAPPLADPVTQDWGPLEGTPDATAADAEDLGWAAEAWAASRGSNSNLRPRRGEEQAVGAAAGLGPASSWELALQQRELRRRQRRGGAAGGQDSLYDDASEAATQGHGYPPANGNSASSASSQQQGQAYASGGGESGYANVYGGAQQQQRQQKGRQEEGQYDEQYGDEEEQYSEAYEPGLSAEPDIALLSSDEVERVLPAFPNSQQASFYNGSTTDGVQRWGIALCATIVFSKVALLAGPSLTYPLWWPWAMAVKKNLALRRQYRYCGLWRTQILEVTVTGRPKPFTNLDSGGGGSTMRMARILVGEPGGAQTEMVLPYDSRYELIQPGEAAELLVLSSDTSFHRFKAIKDVYLPSSGLWVSEYPHADRTQFLEVSLQVEREAQEEASGVQYTGQQYGGGNGAVDGQYGEQQDGKQQQDGGGDGAWQQDEYDSRY